MIANEEALNNAKNVTEPRFVTLLNKQYVAASNISCFAFQGDHKSDYYQHSDIWILNRLTGEMQGVDYKDPNPTFRNISITYDLAKPWAGPFNAPTCHFIGIVDNDIAILKDKQTVFKYILANCEIHKGRLLPNGKRDFDYVLVPIEVFKKL